ncbi:hypothetical protein [Flavobacterium sp.]|uniref:hypothetical protein n=1 Tax=Flavobacterium sp. TaxID=239 RepID=UPI00352779C7
MSETQKVWKPTEEAKSQATQFRLFAVLLWLGAIVAQIFAIRFFLQAVNSGESPVNAWVIGLIVLDLVLVFAGSFLWKKSNRLNPPSEQNKFLFYMQSQLGVVLAFVAFLPLIIFILTNKKVDGKSKAILGSIAGVALLIAGIGGADFNPASVEKYTEETNMVEALTGANSVYYTKGGGKYHLYEDCYTIKNSERLNGTVAEAHAGVANHSDFDLCEICKKKKMKEDGIDAETLNEKVKQMNEKATAPANESVETLETEETQKDAA